MDKEIIDFNKQIEDINNNYFSIETNITECLKKESPQYSNDLETWNSQRFISYLLKTLFFTKEIEYLENISNDIQLIDLTKLGPEIENTIKKVNEINLESQNLSKLNENITSFKQWEKEISNKINNIENGAFDSSINEIEPEPIQPMLDDFVSKFLRINNTISLIKNLIIEKSEKYKISLLSAKKRVLEAEQSKKVSMDIEKEPEPIKDPESPFKYPEVKQSLTKMEEDPKPKPPHRPRKHILKKQPLETSMQETQPQIKEERNNTTTTT
ncbi:hypothetical protein ACTFIR_007548 [Dictyostelium discoideum]